MSNLYMSGNFNVLDLSIQNSLYTVYTAIIISLIAMRFGSTRLQTKIVFIIALFQPSTFISTIIWRDFLGQFYVIFGIYLLLISFNVRTMKAIAMVTTSSLLMSLYRNVYIFFPVMLYFLMYFRVGMKSLRKNLISFFLMISVVFTVYTSKLMLSMNDGYSSYFDGINIKLILFIPINFIRNLIGPFPWTNWFEFNASTCQI